MLIAVDAAAPEPLYLQIRNQIVAGIATGQLEPGQSLPSVRSLASDLGINLHTVNKAYAVLRDEGYVRMRGRAGAVIADPAAADRADADASAQVKMEDDLFKLALAFRARGGARGGLGLGETLEGRGLLHGDLLPDGFLFCFSAEQLQSAKPSPEKSVMYQYTIFSLFFNKDRLKIA